MTGNLIDGVGQLLREAASEAILPRYRKLAGADIEEKTPGELVTVADRESEALIAEGLARLRPDVRIVGEEACAADPSLLDRLDDGKAWLIDPIDGTGNFVAADGPFAVMVALLERGETVAAWVLDPVSDRLWTAERGSGAWLDGERLCTASTSPGAAGLRGMAAGRFMPPDVYQAVTERAAALADVGPTLKCAGADYPLIIAGGRDFALFWRTLPWDHAAGALILAEAGGKVARLNGSPYRPASQGTGLLAASNEAVWADAHAALWA